MNSLLTRIGLRCITMLGALLIFTPVSARCASCYVTFQGGDRYGHEFSLIDSHGAVVPLVTAGALEAVAEWRNRNTQEVTWIPTDQWIDDPEWGATGAWQVNLTGFYAVWFNEHALTLNADTIYYLYDNNTNQYSDPVSFTDDTYSIIAVDSPPMHYGWPDLPTYIMGGLKVFGKARFNLAVRIAPAGDLSMGEFTHEPAN